jgi:hypothetical protein
MRKIISILFATCLLSGSSLAQGLAPGKPAGLKPAMSRTDAWILVGGSVAVGFAVVGWAMANPNTRTTTSTTNAPYLGLTFLAR